MDVEAVTTTDASLLRGVREALSADEAMLCVAFIHARGVHLVEQELKALSARKGARLLVTTTFDQTNGAALSVAAALGVHVRTLNPGSGSTYHPKVYIGKSGRRLSAVVGSANLTGGLATNVEAAVLLRGSDSDDALHALWDWAHRTWEDPRSGPWVPKLAEPSTDDELDPALLLSIETARRENPVFLTLKGQQPNRVIDVSRSGVLIETERSRKNAGAAFVPAWMFNLAWDYVRSRGRLTNAVLLKQLRVHRSSAVCAILARLPGLRGSRDPVGVELSPDPADITAP